MDTQQVLEQARDAITVKRVFGEPYEKDGLTIIPAARVQGGMGGGSGEGDEGKGTGGGYGVNARPIGAFVVRGDDVVWRPAVDVNRMILGGQIVAIVALLTIRTLLKLRAKVAGWDGKAQVLERVRPTR
jgi:uncharacterized spore protein YtfJ